MDYIFDNNGLRPSYYFLQGPKLDIDIEDRYISVAASPFLSENNLKSGRKNERV